MGFEKLYECAKRTKIQTKKFKKLLKAKTQIAIVGRIKNASLMIKPKQSVLVSVGGFSQLRDEYHTVCGAEEV